MKERDKLFAVCFLALKFYAFSELNKCGSAAFLFLEQQLVPSGIVRFAFRSNTLTSHKLSLAFAKALQQVKNVEFQKHTVDNRIRNQIPDISRP